MKNVERQFTLRGFLLGFAGLCVITASSMNVALRLGALPWPTVFVTVISMAVLGKCRNSSLKEINVTHTMMSSGAMVAGGLAFTLPAVWMLNSGQEPDFFSAVTVTVCGSLLGTLFSAMFRKTLIEDRALSFPIGKAAYETLVTGIKKSRDSVILVSSMIFSAIFTAIRDFTGLIPASIVLYGGGTSVGSVSLWVSPMALAIGAMIGKLSAFLWLGGAVFSNFVLAPLGMSPVFRQNLGLGVMMGTGAGVLVKLVAELFAGLKKADGKNKIRVKRSTVLPVLFVVLMASGVLSIGTPLTFAEAAVTCVLCCAATLLSGILTGQSGVNPMEIFGILVMLAVGTLFKSAVGTMIMISSVTAVACGLCGDVTNDLKSGSLLGTDSRQQILAEGIGGVIGAFLSVAVLFAIKKVFGEFGTDVLPAPQAAAVASMAGGMTDARAICIGLAAGIIFYLCKVPAATLGLGIYLSMNISFTVGIGAVIALFCSMRISERKIVTVSSGLLGGEGICGVLIAIISMFAHSIC